MPAEPSHEPSLPSPLLLDGKRVLVTGGSRGIGRAICTVFAREGADVAFCFASNEAAAEETRAAVAAHGRRVFAYRADIADREAANAMAHQAADDLGGIDVLVLNAGINRSSLFLRMPDRDWDDIVGVNINGLYNVGKPVFQTMMRQRAGSIVVITSISGIRTAPAGVPYAVSKAASIGFTKAVAREGGALGIRANAIAVGVVETELAHSIPKPFIQTYLDHAALGRIGRAEETAELAAFLASDRNSYMTGEVVVQDGGVVV